MDFFHVLNRGVDKRVIFLDDQDRLRFIHDLFEFNDQEPVNNLIYRFNKFKDIASPYIVSEAQQHQRKLLVNVHAFNLLPNHYHILLSPLVENGITLFVKKLNIGYAKYFNNKYERSGALFQGRFKSVIIKNEAHFIHLPYYINVINTLDLKYPECRNGNLSDVNGAVKFLDSYRWSSHLDYCGKKNFPSVTQRDLLLKFFGGTNGYKRNTKQWLDDMSLENLEGITLE